MSVYELVSVSLGSAAICVSVGAAVFARRQVNEMRGQNDRLGEALRASATGVLEEGFGRITTSYLEHPDLRAIFYEDEASPPEPVGRDLLLRANTISESLISLFSSALRLSGESEGEQLPWFDRFVEGAFENSTHLRRYAIRRAEWADPRVAEVAHRVEARIAAKDRE